MQFNVPRDSFTREFELVKVSDDLHVMKLYLNEAVEGEERDALILEIPNSEDFTPVEFSNLLGDIAYDIRLQLTDVIKQ